jgi:hypothetical protein
MNRHATLRRAVRRSLSALLFLLVAVGGTPHRARAQPATVPVSRGWPLDRDAQVKVFNPNGRIRVIGWARDSVAVSGTMTRGAQFFGGGSRRGVKMGIEGQGEGAGGEITVHVPSAAVVWVRGAATDITVEGLTGGVDVGCVSGQVRVSGDPRELTAEAMDGGLEIIGSPGTLRAKTASGSLLWMGQAGDATLGSVSGRIQVSRGPMGRVRIETISGDVSLDAALEADADVVIESHSGSVELRLTSRGTTLLTVDAARVTGLPGKPSVQVPGGKRPPPRSVELSGPSSGVGTAQVTVRSFKGELKLLPAVAPPR